MSPEILKNKDHGPEVGQGERREEGTHMHAHTLL
jgi:hypothetical protein